MAKYSNHSDYSDNYTILQIIPCTQKLMAKYDVSKSNDEKEDTYLSPIICFALIEDEDKFRYVVPMDISAEGIIEVPMEYSNFMSIEKGTINPNPGGDK